MSNETKETQKRPMELGLKERVDAADWRNNKELASLRPLYASLTSQLATLTEARPEAVERLAQAEQEAKNTERRMRIDRATLEEAEAAYRAVGACQEALDKLDDSIFEVKRQLELVDPQKAEDLEYEAKLHSQMVLVAAYKEATEQLAVALKQVHDANKLVKYVYESARDQFGAPIGIEDTVRMPLPTGLTYLEWPELELGPFENSTRYTIWLRECTQAVLDMGESQRQLQRKWDKLQASMQQATKPATKAKQAS